MSSLADLPELVGFFSYSREHDADDRGELSALRDCIERELGTQLGRSKEKFGVWQDKEEIRYGTLWEERIKSAVAKSVFFIPIITPRVVKSPYCRLELDLFLDREAMLGRSDLVFPILYIRVPGLENSAQWQNDPVLSVIAKRQYRDWRKFRHQDVNSTDVRQAVADFCEHIADALNVPWLSPQERKKQEEAEARRRAEEERQRQEAEARRREEEAKEDARRKAAAQAQARERAEEERRRQQEEAERVAEAERRRTTAAEAERQRRERDAAAGREAEERRKKEEDERRHAEEEGRRLKPGPAWPPSRRALVTACVLGVVLVGSVGVWLVEPAMVAPPVVPPGDSASRSKAMLDEEDQSDPAGKRFVGSAVWRIDRVAPPPGKPPEIAIRADIEIPEQRISLRWSLRRNDDKALPASHTIEIVFTLPADFPHGDISDIPGVTMKQGESTIGVPLTGLRVKVTNNYFLIGLSSGDAEMQRNIQLLKERSWIDIPVLYGDGKRAIVTIEKGTSGERVFGDAFAAWGKISVVPPVVVPSIVPPAASGSCDSRATTVSLASRCAAPLTGAEERALKPKDGFKECANCPEMVVVPAGSFTMGSPGSETGRFDNEGPQHRVTIGKPFAVGKFSVTFDEWDACVANGGCNGYKPSDQGWGRGRHPVIIVSWNDSQTYVTWLSRRTGKTYRLLSEAEREYVTRAGTTTPFWWGGSISPQQANYDGTVTYGNGPKGEYRGRTLPVDSFEPNPWGLYQVHGNVLEWTQDCYHESYAGAPSDGSAWTTGDCSRRVRRGGAWVIDPGYLRAANRNRNTPDNRGDFIGFRLGRTLTP